MAIIHLPNGLGESLGDSLATTSPLEINGNVWYVNSSTGSDAVSPQGRNRSHPLATLSQANTNAADGDIIVLMDGHSETLTSVINITKELTIIGAGSSSGYPTAKLTNNSAANGVLLDFTGDFGQLRNVWIEECAQANTSHQIIANGEYFYMSGCYFECNGYNEGEAFMIGDGRVIIENTTFISTATSTADLPNIAISIGGASELLFLRGVTVDGGTVGWDNYHAIDLTSNALDTFYAEELSLLRGSDLIVLEATKGFINASTVTGGSRIDWAGVT